MVAPIIAIHIDFWRLGLGENKFWTFGQKISKFNMSNFLTKKLKKIWPEIYKPSFLKKKINF